ncbi:hypothetical protein N9N67_02105 [Bacteriovoracaceae bacterium]|nr:hypothetical protein [Bacteriovoracaceae bacterium]
MKKLIMLNFVLFLSATQYAHADCRMNYTFEILSDKVTEVGKKNLGIVGRNLIRKSKKMKYVSDGSENLMMQATFMESLDNSNTDRFQAFVSLKVFKLDTQSKTEIAQFQGYGISKKLEKNAYASTQFKTALKDAYKNIDSCKKINKL